MGIRGPDRWVGFTYRACLAGTGLGLAVAKTVIDAKSPTGIDEQTIAIGTISAVTLFGDNARTAWRRYKEPDWLESLNRVQLALYALTKTIAGLHPDVETEHLGASLWSLESRRPWRPQPRLKRVYRFRLTASPQAGNVRWTLNKGAIGEAVTNGKPAHRNWRGRNRNCGKTTLIRDKWDKMRPEDQDGFRLKEFRRMVDKYAEVTAVPIVTASGKIIGCLSVDLQAEGAPRAVVLQNEEVWSAMRATGSLVRQDITALG